MGVVSWKLDADYDQAVQAFLKVVDAQVKTERGADRAAAATQRHESAVTRLGQSAGRELGSMVGRWASIGAAVGLATKAMTTMRDELRRLDDLSRGATVSITGRIAAAGDMAAAPQLRQFFAGRA